METFFHDHFEKRNSSLSQLHGIRPSQFAVRLGDFWTESVNARSLVTFRVVLGILEIYRTNDAPVSRWNSFNSQSLRSQWITYVSLLFSQILLVKLKLKFHEWNNEKFSPVYQQCTSEKFPTLILAQFIRWNEQRLSKSVSALESLSTMHCSSSSLKSLHHL